MSWVVGIGMFKGGTGKTTFATMISDHLASMGFDVFGLDCDRSKAFHDWSKVRQSQITGRNKGIKPVPVDHIEESDEDLTSVRIDDSANYINAAVRIARRANPNIVLFDMPGWNSFLAQQAHFHCNLLISPIDVSSRRAADTMINEYGPAVREWREQIPGITGRPAFQWIWAPNKLRIDHQGNPIPAHNRALSRIEKVAEQFGATVTPPLLDNPAIGVASDYGFSVMTMQERALRVHVGANYDQKPMIVNARQVIGQAVAPVFRVTA